MVNLFFALLLFQTSQLFAAFFNFHGSSASINIKGSSVLSVASNLTASGNIKKTSTATITGDSGSKIIFTSGALTQNTNQNTNSLNISSTNSLALTGANNLVCADNTVLENLVVSGTNNSITGSPIFSGTVTLASGADVTVGIKSKMNVDVALASGTFKLSDDLRFFDSKRFTGTGTVNLQNYKLTFGAKPLSFTSAITWFNASDINLGGLTTLSSTWTFTGDAVINGNGNVLDISSTGVIAINAGTTVSITDTYIKGLGSSGDITFANNTTSILRLSNVVIEMTGSKTISGGQVIIDGPVTVVTKNNTLTFSSNGVLTINGQPLQFDRMGYLNGGISPSVAGANLVLNNGARVVEINNADQTPGTTIIGASLTLPFDLFISEDHPISISATSTLSGNGHKIKFSDRSATQLTVANSVTLTTSDLVLEDLQPSQISLGSGSGIIFGNNTTVRLGKNCSLNSTWKFSGTSMLDGQNKMLSLGSSGVIEAQASSTLILKDLTIYDINGTNLRCLDNTGSIIFDNVKLINRNVWRFQNGAFSVLNNLSFLGGGIYSYESAYASTINDNSNLIFSDAITFSYDPAKGAQQAVAGQQNLVFTNTSSKLICDGITLKITNTGMKLTKGTIQFDRKNSIYSDASITDTARSFIFGDQPFDNDLQINVGPDAKIKLESGVINYQNVETILRYGDAILLKHASYELYLDPVNSANINLTGGGNEARLNYTNTTLYSPDSYCYVEPGNTSTRWGVGFLENGVLSGDKIKLEAFADYGLNGFNPAGGTAAYLNSTSDPASQTSFATSPYQTVFNLAYTDYVYGGTNYLTANARIFVKGGVIGQPIKKSDKIYIQFIFPSGQVAYLGSSNLTVSGTKKDLFAYLTNSFSPPPNFTTDFIWKIEDIVSKAYLTSQRYPANDLCNRNVLNFSGISAASNYQF